MTPQNWLSSLARLRQLDPRLQALRTRLLSDPYYRIKSTEITLAVALGIQIDVNQASVDDWLRLPGLSIHQARSLVELSQAGVQFYCLEDIAAALNLPIQRLKPLETILKFYYYDDEIAPPSLVNANTATVEQLLQVPIMQPPLAKAVVQNRLLDGPYQNLADFQQRLSLPGNLTTEMMHYLRF